MNNLFNVDDKVKVNLEMLEEIGFDGFDPSDVEKIKANKDAIWTIAKVDINDCLYPYSIETYGISLDCYFQEKELIYVEKGLQDNKEEALSLNFKNLDLKPVYPSTLLCDFYKLSHKDQYPQGTEYIYSGWTPRSNKYFPRASKVVNFGLQAFIKKYLIEHFDTYFFGRSKENVSNEYKRYIKHALGVSEPDATHIEELHDLGYLPIKIKSLKEGTLVPIKVPMFTIENTHPDFFWLTNYLETMISAEIWQPMVSATIAHTYRQLINEYAMKTTGSIEGTDFQCHDFSARGMAGLEAGASSGAGHLLSNSGTDTVLAIAHLEKYYNANIEEELVGASIPATEHSVMCAYGDVGEFELFEHLMTNVYPNGFFSVVSDTWDFWKVVEEYLPKLKDKVLSRDGKVVIRPDSGDPVEILCGKNIISTFKNKKEITEELIEEFRSKKDLQSYEYLVSFKNDYLRGFGIKSKKVYRFKVERVGGSIVYGEVEPTEISAEEKGLIECLWDTFGGEVNSEGYKVLDSHIGAIYGDSITLDRAEEILKRLELKGFASTNIVFGIGSYTYQYNTRDTFGFAMKATWAMVNGEERFLFKDPKTDDGTKKSLKGRIAVVKVNGELVVVDELNLSSYEANFSNIDLLETVYENGNLIVDDSLSDIRSRLAESSGK